MNKSKLLLLKLKREIIRLAKPLLGQEKTAQKLRQVQDAVCRVYAHAAAEVDINSLFAPARHKPEPRAVDVLIPVYNGFDFLDPCLQNVMAHTDLPFHVYLANDASTDARVLPLLKEWAAKYPDKITLLEIEQNGGFAKTINTLIAASTRDFVLLNTDTEVPPGWASRLFYPIFTDETVASCGPWTNAGGAYQSFFFDNQERPLDFPPEQMDRLAQAFSPDAQVTLPNLMGFCMAITRKAVQEGGVMDPTYGRGYFEETDWCLRQDALGKTHRLVPNLFVYHKGFSSYGGAVREKLLRHNRKIFQKRYPHAEKWMRQTRFDGKLQALHFLLLAYYLKAKYSGFSSVSEQTETAKPVLLQTKEDGLFLSMLKLGEDKQYLYTTSELTLSDSYKK